MIARIYKDDDVHVMRWSGNTGAGEPFHSALGFEFNVLRLG